MVGLYKKQMAAFAAFYSSGKWDCFACGSAFTGGDAFKQKEPFCGLFCNLLIPPPYKHVVGIRKLQKVAYATSFCLSGKRDSNPRPSAWEADALPLSYSRMIHFRSDKNNDLIH